MTAVAAAYAECAARARAHYENFPIGSWLLPRHLRRDLAAVYAFARMGDDVADEGGATPAARLAALDAMEAALLACTADPVAAREPVFLALGHTIARHGLAVEPFRDLLVAFRRDAAGETLRFATDADLEAYCRCSANPVGRIVLGLFGHHDPTRQALSDDVCTALQLTNFWQDVPDDYARRGRVYLPEEHLARFPEARMAIERGRVTSDFRACLAERVASTRARFARGRRLADLVSGRLAREVRLFVGGGLAILDRIDAAGGDVFAGRPRLGRGDLARLIWKEVWR